MLDEMRGTPLAAYMQVASCVPAAGAEFETTGASIGPEEVAEAFTWGKDVIALGEVMNFLALFTAMRKCLERFKLRCGQADLLTVISHTLPATGDCQCMLRQG